MHIRKSQTRNNFTVVHLLLFSVYAQQQLVQLLFSVYTDHRLKTTQSGIVCLEITAESLHGSIIHPGCVTAKPIIPQSRRLHNTPCPRYDPPLPPVLVFNKGWNDYKHTPNRMLPCALDVVMEVNVFLLFFKCQ